MKCSCICNLLFMKSDVGGQISVMKTWDLLTISSTSFSPESFFKHWSLKMSKQSIISSFCLQLKIKVVKLKYHIWKRIKTQNLAKSTDVQTPAKRVSDNFISDGFIMLLNSVKQHSRSSKLHWEKTESTVAETNRNSY